MCGGSSVIFQMETQNISRRRSHSPGYPELGHFTLFCREQQKNDLYRTNMAIVLLIQSFCLVRFSLLSSLWFAGPSSAMSWTSGRLTSTLTSSSIEKTKQSKNEYAG